MRQLVSGDAEHTRACNCCSCLDASRRALFPPSSILSSWKHRRRRRRCLLHLLLLPISLPQTSDPPILLQEARQLARDVGTRAHTHTHLQFARDVDTHTRTHTLTHARARTHTYTPAVRAGC